MVKRLRPRTSPHRYDRLGIFQAIVVGFAAIIAIRLFTLQILRHEAYASIAENQHNLSSKLTPNRGDIFVKDRANPDELFPLATSRDEPLVYAVPDTITDPQATATALAPILGISSEELIPKLSKPKDVYEVLKRRLQPTEVAAIEGLQLKGIKFENERWRYYPEKNLASHLIGFVGYQGDDKKGVYGVEAALDEVLAGTAGKLQEESSARAFLPVGAGFFAEAINGANVILTLDHTVQYQACSKLATAVSKHGADGGALAIMEVQTGRLLAVCGQPDFDPNEYNKTENPSAFNNPVVFGAYEPGSVFKAITMATALDLGKVTPQSTYVDTGQVKIGSFTIRNSDEKAYGTQTMVQVLEKSLNTGAIHAAELVGRPSFSKYVKNFGFGEKTGVELSGEVEGNISSLTKSGDIFLATGSFGQGLTVTPIQLLAAFGAIANSGKLLKPYLVDEIRYPDGKVEKNEIQVVRQVIRPDTASTLAAMLVNVVERGHGQRAGVKGYYVAGKTGTAQVRATTGSGYDPHKTIGTFAGFAPVESPRFAMVVRIDVPKDVQFAESSAAPLFGEVMDFLLKYYDIAPTRLTP
ncbi:penicillin-binding protein 2 [Candidatus Parcubacteria bacterium]|jgi:cell division protein FtsI/penicillin-binding protein 2|nr:MAG: penicillin-binding protein 2 [Candidatus Parcubacteria bacterium]